MSIKYIERIQLLNKNYVLKQRMNAVTLSAVTLCVKRINEMRDEKANGCAIMDESLNSWRKIKSLSFHVMDNKCVCLHISYFTPYALHIKVPIV